MKKILIILLVIRLEELLNADNFNFVQDIVGIQRHIDREKKEIKRFLPRFSGKVV